MITMSETELLYREGKPSAEKYRRVYSLLEKTALDEKMAFSGSGVPEDLIGKHWLLPYNLDDQGVLSIPVSGELVPDTCVTVPGWFTGYNYIQGVLSYAESDDRVKAVVLDVDSPGGTVTGCIQTSKVIENFTKPTLAVSDGLVASAAFWLSSSADSLWVTEDAEIGSVGVIVVHFSYQEYLENEGVKPTIISAGTGKGLGNPFFNLNESDQKKIQARIDSKYDKFVTHISKNMGISKESIIENGAEVYDGKQALAKGYVDRLYSHMGELSKEVYDTVNQN